MLSFKLACLIEVYLSTEVYNFNITKKLKVNNNLLNGLI